MTKSYWSVVIIIVLVGGYLVVDYFLTSPFITEEDILEMKAEVKDQNESAFKQPKPQKAVYPDKNPLKNVYFGDLHGHSDLSFDAYIFGNRLSLDQSYRIAKGEAVKNSIGELMQLTRPLDFAAMTDHAETFGMHEGCVDPEITSGTKDLCRRLENPDLKFFFELREQAEVRPPISRIDESMQNKTKAHHFADNTWKEIVEIAEQHNEPGRFTTFAAYEYSPPLPDSGKLHRNVIFKNNQVPKHAISMFDALTEIDLWAELTSHCQAPCKFLTIPHNPNRSWGLAFAGQTMDGDLYTIDDWSQRDKVEPLVEMFQIKGNSECSVGFGTTDEECNFEQFLPLCEKGETTGCIHPTSMARDGLKKGIELENNIGFNPLDFGMIGSTDTHNSNPGDTEEWDFRGSSGVMSAPAKKRLKENRNMQYNPGGLAAIWAIENTREALFDAMLRKEVYATSGTRIKLRFFGSFEFDQDLLKTEKALQIAYSKGVPMGSKLESSNNIPSFFIWAKRDPIDAPLEKIQIIKGWTENGDIHEKVMDIACSNGPVNEETGFCKKTEAVVDLNNCSISENIGSEEIKIQWSDLNYNQNQNAFYYIRVIQNPTCRWSTYDSLRIGKEAPKNFASTVNEMAWSSPIWISKNLQ